MEERNLKDKSLVSLSRARDDDMISKLPDSLISHILLDLPTKEAVRTCVLSKRWKSLWLLTPGLDLKSNEFPNYNAFVSFMNKLLDFSRVHYSCLHKLKLGIHDSPFDRSYLTLWIHFVATHKVKVLDVESFVVDRVFLKVMPLSLYICETLVYLRLHRVFLGNFGSASLTCLKTLCLEQNIYANEAVLESLILSCPVLEDLKIGRMFDENVRVLRVRSKTITSLGIIKHYLGRNDFEIQELEVLIDTPNLKYLNLEDEFPKRKTFCELSSLTEANFLGGLSLRDSVDPLLSTSIFGVRDMKISSKAFKFIQRILIKPSPPEFCNLSSLEAKLDLSNLRTLPWFLSSCPNIRSLILDLQDFYPRREKLIILSLVPQCLLSSLEYVEIKKVSPFTRDPNEMEVAKYFLENSIVLKKFVLRLRCSLREEDLVVYKEDLLKLRRQSSARQRCQIVVCS